MSLTPAPTPVALARFRTVVPGETIDVEVHFNPATLQYTLSNTVQPAPGGRRVQYVSQTTARLTMDLIFDTTHNGHDVREVTLQMSKLLKPHGPSGRRVPPVVEFTWGTYSFRGTVEQYRETMEYFSPEGVPLRSSINLTLTTPDATFSANTSATTNVEGGAGAPGAGPLGQQQLTNVAVPSGNQPGGAAGVANALGNPRAARAIASANDSTSLRFSDGAELAVGGQAGVTLQAAAAFSAGGGAGLGLDLGVSGGVGLGASGGAGFGASLGLTAGASAGIGAGVSLGAGAGVSFGAGAGVAAGAALRADFSGLRSTAGVTSGAAMPDALTALAQTTSARAECDVVGVGGKAQSSGSASLAVDVSGDGGLNARLRFGP